MLGRILGIDYGGKRVGLAVSDPTKTIAQPLTTLEQDGSGKWWQQLATIIQDQAVEVIVVGYPLTMKGSASMQTSEVDKFITELQSQQSIPVYRYDERLTSVAARRNLVERGIKTGSNKGMVDRIAAALMLQDYLDCQK
ncbi:Holliday junction resolvase RuvX [Candidatus Neomarinimicrobiota bacterium]